MAQNLPKTFKAAIFKKANAPLTFEDVELKLPTYGQVLVKMLAAGVCHSDAGVQAGALGDVFPRIPGHEIVGDVVAGPPTEKKWKVGDRVGGTWHGGHDGVCKACNRGLHQMCENEAINGVTKDGGYAEYTLLRTEAVISVPLDIDPAECAPLLCAGVTVFNGMRRQGIYPGSIVAVQGLGGLGHLAVQFAAKMGYRVVALSSSGSKEKFAKDLGAHDYLDGSKVDQAAELTKMGGASMVVATAPNMDIVKGLAAGLEIGGKILLLALAGDVSAPTPLLITRGLSIQGWPAGNALDCEETIAFADLQGVKCLVEKFPFEKAQEAFEHMLSGKARFRSVITF
ncbi:MAG: hypothetical protein Q9191_008006 [Dirinaria sp. TL-2023a]